MKKCLVLFSGGKDCVCSLESLSKDTYEITALVSAVNKDGETQLSDGREIQQSVRRKVADLFPYHYEEIILSKRDYVDQLYAYLLKLLKKYGADTIITGDLDHPDGIAGFLLDRGINASSPAKEYYKKHGKLAYTQRIFQLGIKAIISGVRHPDLSEDFIGKEYSPEIVSLIGKRNVDPTGEDGEFQTFVLSSPSMKGSLQIESFDIQKGIGRDKKNYTYSHMVDVVTKNS